MLAYALAIVVGLSSLVLFLTAFVMSDVHRQDDFFWSGIGLFYALVLWFCATRITGGLLLGQVAAVALIVSNNWQIIKLRKAIINPEAAAKLNQFSILSLLGGVLSRKPSSSKAPQVETQETPKITDKEIAIPEEGSEPTTTIPPSTSEEVAASQPVTSETATPATEETKTSQTGFFSRFFGGKKQQEDSPVISKDTTPITNTKLNDILDDAEIIDTQTASEAESEDSKSISATETEPQVISPPETAESVTETTTQEAATPESPTVSEPESEDSKSISATEVVEIIDVKIEETIVKSAPTATESANNPTVADNQSKTPEQLETSTPTNAESATDSSPKVEINPQEVTVEKETTENKLDDSMVTSPLENQSPEVTEAQKTTQDQQESILDIDEFLEEMKREQDKPSNPS